MRRVPSCIFTFQPVPFLHSRLLNNLIFRTTILQIIRTLVWILRVFFEDFEAKLGTISTFLLFSFCSRIRNSQFVILSVLFHVVSCLLPLTRRRRPSNWEYFIGEEKWRKWNTRWGHLTMWVSGEHAWIALSGRGASEMPKIMIKITVQNAFGWGGALWTNQQLNNIIYLNLNWRFERKTWFYYDLFFSLVLFRSFMPVWLSICLSRAQRTHRRVSNECVVCTR